MAIPFVPVPAIRVLLKGTDQGRIFSTGLYACKNPGVAPTEAECSAMATAIAAAMTDNAFLADTSPSVTYTEVEARNAFVERSFSSTVAIDQPGTAADGNPSAIAAKAIIEPGPGVFQFRPSQMFIPGVPTSALIEPGSDQLTTAYIDAALTFITSLQNAMTTVPGYNLACVSKFLAKVARSPALVSQTISYDIRPRVATQVRRLRRVSRSGT